MANIFAFAESRGTDIRKVGLEAVTAAALIRRLLKVIGDREPVEALRVGELPQPAHLVERTAHVADVDPEFHVTLR